MEDIKQIRIYTLTDYNIDCDTIEEAMKYLSDTLINEYDCRHYFNGRKMQIKGRTLVLFKFKSRLIGKGIITDLVREGTHMGRRYYEAYYSLENGSIRVFNRPIDLEILKEYFPAITTLFNRSLIFDLSSMEKINQMIDDYS